MDTLDDLVKSIYSATVSEVQVLVREVRVQIGVLPRMVTVRIYYDPRCAEPYSFELSARMSPTGQAQASSSCTAPSEAEALRHAVRSLTQGYEDAVRRGELPRDSWLTAEV